MLSAALFIILHVLFEPDLCAQVLGMVLYQLASMSAALRQASCIQLEQYASNNKAVAVLKGSAMKEHQLATHGPETSLQSGQIAAMLVHGPMHTGRSQPCFPRLPSRVLIGCRACSRPPFPQRQTSTPPAQHQATLASPPP